jgi:hypothetical protein
MNRIEWQEDDPDQDGEVAMSLTIISGDPVLLGRARKMIRQILDDRSPLTPISTFPRNDDGGD